MSDESKINRTRFVIKKTKQSRLRDKQGLFNLTHSSLRKAFAVESCCWIIWCKSCVGISREIEYGKTERRGTLPDSLTRFSANCLHISSILTTFVQKLNIRWFELNVLITAKLKKISDMYNLLLIFINLNKLRQRVKYRKGRRH